MRPFSPLRAVGTFALTPSEKIVEEKVYIESRKKGRVLKRTKSKSRNRALKPSKTMKIRIDEPNEEQ